VDTHSQIALFLPLLKADVKKHVTSLLLVCL